MALRQFSRFWLAIFGTGLVLGLAYSNPFEKKPLTRAVYVLKPDRIQYIVGQVYPRSGAVILEGISSHGSTLLDKRHPLSALQSTIEANQQEQIDEYLVLSTPEFQDLENFNHIAESIHHKLGLRVHLIEAKNTNALQIDSMDKLLRGSYPWGRLDALSASIQTNILASEFHLSRLWWKYLHTHFGGTEIGANETRIKYAGPQ